MIKEQSPTYDELKSQLALAKELIQAIREGRMDTIHGKYDALVVHLEDVKARGDHFKQVLLAIRKVNRLMLSEEDPLELIRQACVNLTENMGYLNTWIVLLDHDGRIVSETANSGFNGGFAILDKRLKEGEFTRHMQLTLESDKVVVAADPKTMCLDCPLSQDYGGRSGLSSRLHYDGKTYGILSVSIPPAYAHDPEEQALLKEVASDLAFALYKIETTKHLKKSQMMFARTERIANIGSWEWDPAADRVIWSEGLFRMFRMDSSKDAPSFAEHPNIYVAEDMQRLQQVVERCLTDGTPYELEVRAIRTDGEIRHCIARGHAETDPEGRIHHLVGSMQDVTERKQSEEALKDHHHYLQAILQTSAEGFWVIDSHKKIIEVNNAYCALSGYTRDEILGMKIADIDADETPVDTAARIQRIIANGSELFETRHRRKDGSLWPVQVSTTWLEQNEGFFVCFCRDLTERKQWEERISLQSHMLDISPVSITIHDTEGRFYFANHMTASMHGYDSQDDFLAINLRELDAPESEALLNQRFRQITEAGEASFEVVHFRRDGSTFPMEVITKSIELHGKPGVLSIGTDITERKKAEDQLRQAQKMESVGRLAGGVAHDFNNMLSVIMGNAELAIDSVAPDDPIHDRLQEILSAAMRSADITQQLLAFARKQNIAPVALDLNETVEGILKMLRRLIGENIDLAWLPGAGLGSVLMDPSQINQVLANLCVNARDAISDVGNITIETGLSTFDRDYCENHTGFAPGDFVYLALSDNGCGMDRKTLDNLFEPFFTTKEVGKGTGLGLATVYGIVKQNNGFINVYSEPGNGTTFKIYLPQHETPAEAVGQQDAEAQDARGSETVLLVEDELAILKMTTMMLEKLGYSVLAANAADEALKLAEMHAGEIHLLITDVIMPAMNGRHLVDQLKALYPQIKVLFMSGYTANVIAHHGILDEGVNFIQKPFSKNDISMKVREVLDV